MRRLDVPAIFATLRGFMPTAAPTFHRLSLWRRIIAAGGAMVVLALAVLAASPKLHAKLHGADADHDSGCAVALFAGGVSAPAASATLPPRVVPHDVPAAIVWGEIMLSAPRYLRQPERGPPGRG